MGVGPEVQAEDVGVGAVCQPALDRPVPDQGHGRFDRAVRLQLRQRPGFACTQGRAKRCRAQQIAAVGAGHLDHVVAGYQRRIGKAQHGRPGLAAGLDDRDAGGIEQRQPGQAFTRRLDQPKLRLAADGYLPTGEGQIPTGEIRPLAGTGFDFREARRIDAKGTADYDHCFVVNGSGLRPVADLVASDGRVRMTLDADQPGVQLYTGFKMDITASDGAHIGPRAGLCLETECFPDAPNKPEFPSSILRPNETYRHRMVHRFAVAGA